MRLPRRMVGNENRVFLRFEKTNDGCKLIIGRCFAAVLIALIAALAGANLPKPLRDVLSRAAKYYFVSQPAPQSHPAKNEVFAEREVNRL
jgi:hypothetical protein